MPTYCSVGIAQGSSIRSDKSLQPYGKFSKTGVESVLPDIPLHLSGFFSTSYNEYLAYITDDILSFIRRSYDYYYKFVFTYKSEIVNNEITLSSIELDNTNSKFYFSSRNDLGGCAVDLGKEISYKYRQYCCYS